MFALKLNRVKLGPLIHWKRESIEVGEAKTIIMDSHLLEIPMTNANLYVMIEKCVLFRVCNLNYNAL